jgi:DNA-binding NarL/FixJ family response regulator
MARKKKTTRKNQRILIVDDHPVVRFGLSEAIAKTPGLTTCGEASNVSEALQQVRATSPDLAIVDISLEDENGLRLIEQIKTEYPETRILVSSFHEEAVYAPRALQAGAMGYIEKGKPIQEIVDAVLRVLEGELFLSPEMGSRLIQRAATGKSFAHEPSEMLSNRELEVFEMVGRGMTVNEIARRLQVSPKTVDSHRTNIKTKLKLKNSAQLTHQAFNWVREQH